MKNMTIITVFAILTGLATVAVAKTIYTYKCGNVCCRYIMQFEQPQVCLKCPQCGWMMSKSQ